MNLILLLNRTLEKKETAVKETKVKVKETTVKEI